jgi:YebC/PmpR family DNA-binding regulatory protein
MSGHSKWANIKHRKGANDLKKAKYFGKLIREISAAVKQGGISPDANPRLRLAIQNAKGANMPKDNIERAIKKGAGGDSADYSSVVYEGHGPHGVAVIVECMTDNLNRTVASVRAAFSKHGGGLGKHGSVSFMFDKKGVFSIEAPKVSNEENFILTLIDAGADAVDTEDGYFYVTCSLENFGNLQKQLEELQIEPTEAAVQYIPHTLVEVADEGFVKVMKLIEVLEDEDDVQKVYHNLVNKETQLALLS